MKVKRPTIRIKDAWLLRQNASIYLNELWGNGEPLRSNEEYAQIALAYKKAQESTKRKY